MREPEALLGASFQLSFGATLSILAILPQWERVLGRRERWRRWIKDAGIMGLTVHLGIWPLLVFYFHRLSLAGFLANWTVFPLSGIIMVMGLAVGTWGVCASHPVPEVVVMIVRLTVHMTLELIKRMSAWRWAIIPIAPPPGWVSVLYYGFLFGILFMIHRRKIYAENDPSFKAGRARLQRR